MTPLRPMKLPLSSMKAQPRGSFDNTKTGIRGPNASAIFPASDHLVEMMKLGARSKIGAFVRSRHANASSIGSAKPDLVVKLANGHPVEACTTATPAIAASSAEETKEHRRSVTTETPSCSTHAPSNGKAKNHPGIDQCGCPRPPQRGVSVNRMIGGK